MAATYTLHVRTPEVTDDVLKDFFSHSVGSKFYDTDREPRKVTRDDLIRFRCMNPIAYFKEDGTVVGDPMYLPDYAFYLLTCGTPQFEVGDVSFLKAALFGDDERYVPSPIALLSELFHDEEGIIVTDEVIAQAAAAFTENNRTLYDVVPGEEVVEFLTQYKGHRVFAIAW